MGIDPGEVFLNRGRGGREFHQRALRASETEQVRQPSQGHERAHVRLAGDRGFLPSPGQHHSAEVFLPQPCGQIVQGGLRLEPNPGFYQGPGLVQDILEVRPFDD